METCPRALFSITLAVLLLARLPLEALEYEIRMVNGNVFHTRYEPVAPFDTTRLMFMTLNGNPSRSARQCPGGHLLTEASGFASVSTP